MKRITLNIILLITIISYWGCTKVFDEVKVQIHVDEYFMVKPRFPDPIPYSASGEKIDSICLIVDGMINNTQYTLESSIDIIAEPYSDPIIKIAVYHHSGLITYSESVKIRTKSYHKPDIKMVVTNTNGDEDYYLGEKLRFKFQSLSSDIEINSVHQIKLSFNGKDLGTDIEYPFVFETDNLIKEENQVVFELVDHNGISHTYEETINAEINLGPTIRINLDYFPWADEYNLLSTKDMQFEISAYDLNMKVDYIELYIDDELKFTKQVAETSYYERITIDSLSPSIHKIYCIAYDERGASTKSTQLKLIVNNSINIDYDERIIKLIPTDNQHLILGISNTKIYKIDPINEEIIDISGMPYGSPTCMDFVVENQKLYIGYRNGIIMSWNHLDSNFELIAINKFRSIKGIKIDFALNKAIVLDWNMQGNLCALDLDTKDTIQLPVYVYDDCTFGYDKNNHYAYIGGRENYVDHFYKIEIKENSMHIKDKFSNLSSHDIKSILLNSEANKIILQQENAYLYDLDDFGNQLGEIGEAWPKNIHYSSDERKIIIAGDTDNHFSVYNSSTYELEKQYLLLYPDYNNIICTMPIMFSNKVMLIMENYHDDTSRIIFYQY